MNKRPARRGGDEHEDVIDTLRLSDPQWHALLDQLDRASAETGGRSSGRRDERLPYRNITYMLVAVRYEDGRTHRFRVRTHNISRSGLGFLHGNYIHVGTSAELVLFHLQRGVTRVPATVKRCQHLSGTIHHVGVEFHSPLEDLDNYLLAVFDDQDPAAPGHKGV